MVLDKIQGPNDVKELKEKNFLFWQMRFGSL